MEVHIVDAEMGFPRTTGDHIRVLTVPDPKDSRKIITNVLCRYVVSGVEVSFRKNPHDADESFEDALNWAKSFARVHNIDDVYAANLASG
ncbi:MAG: hypothetical protein OXQ92_04375 [Boseongicola sp.]|nr:hypothetical protein [Boseongicola sp.]MDD9976218.1 hypothetical protein [Boseongicola sp.]